MYCNNKCFRRVKGKLNDKKYNKLLYRILKKYLKIQGYSKRTWNEHIFLLTLENFKNYFNFVEIQEWKINYEILVFKRFSRFYL